MVLGNLQRSNNNEKNWLAISSLSNEEVSYLLAFLGGDVQVNECMYMRDANDAKSQLKRIEKSNAEW